MRQNYREYVLSKPVDGNYEWSIIPARKRRWKTRGTVDCIVECLGRSTQYGNACSLCKLSNISETQCEVGHNRDWRLVTIEAKVGRFSGSRSHAWTISSFKAWGKWEETAGSLGLPPWSATYFAACMVTRVSCMAKLIKKRHWSNQEARIIEVSLEGVLDMNRSHRSLSHKIVSSELNSQSFLATKTRLHFISAWNLRPKKRPALVQIKEQASLLSDE